MLFYVVAVTAPFLDLRLTGQLRFSRLATGPAVLTKEGLWEMGAAVLATTIILPLAKIAVCLTVLLGLRLPRPPRWLYVPLRWLEPLGPWSMIEVYVLGLFVAYTRLTALAEVRLDTACYALIGLMVTMVAADAALDPVAVWDELERRGLDASPARAADGGGAGRASLLACHVCHKVSQGEDGDRCPRCATTLHRRKTGSLARSAALALAATVLYIPANYYPVMYITKLGQTTAYTILGGVKELAAAGLWPLALLVFFASITVPVLKLVALLILLVSTRQGSLWRLNDRTRLYRLIVFIGRWSMIDVFMVSILVAVVRFGFFARVTSDIGGVAFAGVVLLTMVAADAFDPRLMWDAAEARAPAPADRGELDYRQPEGARA